MVNKFNDGSPNNLLDGISLEPSLVCQHLFSRAYPDIPSPHNLFERSTSEYVHLMLDKTDDQERLILLRNALQIYAREVSHDWSKLLF